MKRVLDWNNVGNFDLGVERNLRNYSSNSDYGSYGCDTLSLGYLGSSGPTVERSVTTGIETKDFYLGTIGFSVSQTTFTDGASPDLVPRNSPNDTSSSITANKSSSAGFSRGALAGTVAGAVIIFLLVIGAISLLFWKRRRRRTRQIASKQEEIEQPETDSSRSIIGGELNTEVGDGKYRPSEVEGTPGSRGDLAEAEGSHGGAEVEGTGGGAELHGSGAVTEMDGKGMIAEMDAVPVYEPPAGEVKAKVPRFESGQKRIRVAREAAVMYRHTLGISSIFQLRWEITSE
ncbi:MAG: hypothetical protein Q9166_005421 [cf. Caloplaca sp. 2 TL-2023]